MQITVNGTGRPAQCKVLSATRPWRKEKRDTEDSFERFILRAISLEKERGGEGEVVVAAVTVAAAA